MSSQKFVQKTRSNPGNGDNGSEANLDLEMVSADDILQKINDTLGESRQNREQDEAKSHWIDDLISRLDNRPRRGCGC